MEIQLNRNADREFVAIFIPNDSGVNERFEVHKGWPVNINERILKHIKDNEDINMFVLLKEDNENKTQEEIDEENLIDKFINEEVNEEVVCDNPRITRPMLVALDGIGSKTATKIFKFGRDKNTLLNAINNNELKKINKEHIDRVLEMLNGI